MKLYVCWGTFKRSARPGWKHPCGTAYTALREAGHDPEVIKGYGWALLPDALNQTEGRKEAERLTGSNELPVLVLDDGTAISDSAAIAEWARQNPATKAA